MFSSQRTPRGVGIAALGVAALLIGVLALPGIALAKQPLNLQIGPFKAAHGYTFTLLVSNCNGTNKRTEIDYSKGTEADNADYSYNGSATCTASPNLKHGTLSITWPGIASVTLKSSAAGAVKQGVIPKGCKGSGGSSREVVLKGSIGITASKYFGKLKSRSVKGYISRLGNLNCASEKLPNSTDLETSFGQNLFLTASRYKKLSEVFIGDTFAPATGVTGTFDLDVTGKASPFEINTTTATLTDLKPFATGKLVATKQATCTGDTTKAVNVVFGGTITIDSPVLGSLVLGATAPEFATLGPSNAMPPSDCDGYGAIALTPSVSNDCDESPGYCSVSSASNTDTFDDDSNPGTQKIVSETINYGDGSPTVPFTSGQTYTYANPGTFTATVTIVTSNGQTQTATTPVYIIS